MKTRSLGPLLLLICNLSFKVSADVFPASDWFGTNLMKQTSAVGVIEALGLDNVVNGLDLGATNQWGLDATNAARAAATDVTNLINANSVAISNALAALEARQNSYLLKTNPVVSVALYTPKVIVSNTTPASAWSIGISNQSLIISNLATAKTMVIDTNGTIFGNLSSTDSATLTNIVNGLTIPLSEVTNLFAGKTNPTVFGTLYVPHIVLSNATPESAWSLVVSNNALNFSNRFTGLGLLVGTNGNSSGTDASTVTSIVNGLTVPLSDLTNAFVGQMFNTNNPPASAAIGGQSYLWNSNSTRYVIKSGPFSTAWTSTNAWP